MVTITKKICRPCGQELPITEFYRNSGAADRRSSMCKRHHREAVLRRYHMDPKVRARVITQAKRWRRQNPFQVKAHQAAKEANRRAAKFGLLGRIRGKDVIQVWERCGCRCLVCGTDLSTKDRNLTLDHRIPMRFGGPNHPSNLRATCLSCNLREYWRIRRERLHRAAA